MAKQVQTWGPLGPISVYEWSLLDIGQQLSRRPVINLIDDNDGTELLDEGLPCQMPALVCVDGTKLSVQAGAHYHSVPNSNFGPFTHVEVGFPSSEPPETWKQYAEEADKPMNTIYSRIPLSLVMLFVGAHGGVDRGATFGGYEFQLR